MHHSSDSFSYFPQVYRDFKSQLDNDTGEIAAQNVSWQRV
jgi:hypothetical protein